MQRDNMQRDNMQRDNMPSKGDRSCPLDVLRFMASPETVSIKIRHESEQVLFKRDHFRLSAKAGFLNRPAGGKEIPLQTIQDIDYSKLKPDEVEIRDSSNNDLVCVYCQRIHQNKIWVLKCTNCAKESYPRNMKHENKQKHKNLRLTSAKPEQLVITFPRNNHAKL